MQAGPRLDACADPIGEQIRDNILVVAETALVDPEEGMAQKFASSSKGGSELYVGAGGREHG
jgi:hypothetical protein